MLESIIVLPRVRQRACVYVWNKVVRENGSSLEKFVTRPPNVTWKSQNRGWDTSIPQSGIWRTCTCSLGIPRRGGWEPEDKPSCSYAQMYYQYFTVKGKCGPDIWRAGEHWFTMKTPYSEICSVTQFLFLWNASNSIFLRVIKIKWW